MDLKSSILRGKNMILFGINNYNLKDLFEWIIE